MQYVFTEPFMAAVFSTIDGRKLVEGPVGHLDADGYEALARLVDKAGGGTLTLFPLPEDPQSKNQTTTQDVARPRLGGRTIELD